MGHESCVGNVMGFVDSRRGWNRAENMQRMTGNCVSYRSNGWPSPSTGFAMSSRNDTSRGTHHTTLACGAFSGVSMVGSCVCTDRLTTWYVWSGVATSKCHACQPSPLSVHATCRSCMHHAFQPLTSLSSLVHRSTASPMASVVACSVTQQNAYEQHDWLHACRSLCHSMQSHRSSSSPPRAWRPRPRRPCRARRAPAAPRPWPRPAWRTSCQLARCVSTV